MAKEPLRVIFEGNRAPAPADRKPAIKQVSNMLMSCGFHGEWKLTYIERIRHRGDQGPKCLVDGEGRLFITLKPRGQDSGMRCGLRPPKGIPAQAVVQAISTSPVVTKTPIPTVGAVTAAGDAVFLTRAE